MKITLLTVGKNNDRQIDSLIQRYTERLSHYTKFEISTVADPKTGRNADINRQKTAEGKAILSALKPSDYVILLDERGDQPTSRQFAQLIERHLVHDSRDIFFVVGGPFGFSDEVYRRADRLMALSRMTLTHEMVRLFFVEQTYRAFTIIRGENYHHD